MFPAHLAGRDDEVVRVKPLLDLVPDRKAFLGTGLDTEDLATIRAPERSGRPLGGTKLLARLEARLSRRLHKAKPGGGLIPRKVAADAVHFVSNDAESLLYVHADHLGTPQRMTNQAAALVWDRIQRPFGETASLTGSAANPQRFPGQIHDPETGFHYNYFHDYDPTIGRYLQSDPIGLDGGLNTYAYVGGNPVRFIDPFGLATCGSGWNEPFVSDNPFGFPFSSCCADHDQCYGTCGASKSECDDDFRDCMNSQCSRYEPNIGVFCRYVASTYYGAVRDFGQSAFDEAQKSACQDGQCDEQ